MTPSRKQKSCFAWILVGQATLFVPCFASAEDTSNTKNQASSDSSAVPQSEADTPEIPLATEVANDEAEDSTSTGVASEDAASDPRSIDPTTGPIAIADTTTSSASQGTAGATTEAGSKGPSTEAPAVLATGDATSTPEANADTAPAATTGEAAATTGEAAATTGEAAATTGEAAATTGEAAASAVVVSITDPSASADGAGGAKSETLAGMASGLIGPSTDEGTARGATTVEGAYALQPSGEDDLPIFGLMLDAGLPDGVNGSLVYRPFYWLRLHAGAGFNLVSPGVRGGASIVPIDFWVSPSFVVEAGHYFEGDANSITRMITGDQSFESAALRRVGYDYANAHLGLEFASETVTFYLHGGMTYLKTAIHLEDEATTSVNGEAISFRQSPRISGFAPSAKLGLIVYLF